MVQKRQPSEIGHERFTSDGPESFSFLFSFLPLKTGEHMAVSDKDAAHGEARAEPGSVWRRGTRRASAEGPPSQTRTRSFGNDEWAEVERTAELTQNTHAGGGIDTKLHTHPDTHVPFILT